MKEQIGVNGALVASGSGTDADSIMKAWKAGCIPEVKNLLLISTKEGAGCLDKASQQEVLKTVIPCKGPSEIERFNKELSDCILELGVELIFLVGCVHKVFPIEGVDIYNIHPQEIPKHGGDGFYGLKPHRNFLDDVANTISMGKKSTADRFFALPTVHEVIMKYDSGAALLVQHVEIPKELIVEYFKAKHTTFSEEALDAIAEKVQKHILPYEHLMLPPAVRMAAKKIIDRRKGG